MTNNRGFAIIASLLILAVVIILIQALTVTQVNKLKNNRLNIKSLNKKVEQFNQAVERSRHEKSQ